MIETMNPVQSATYYQRLERAYARKGDKAMAAAMKSKRLAALGLDEYDDEGAAPLGRALAAAAAAPSAPAASSEHVPIIIIDAEGEADREAERPEIVPMANHAPEPEPDWRPIEIVGGDE